MNKQELIEKIENLNKLYGERYYVAIDDVLNLVNQLDEPEKPIRLKDVIKRIKGFDDGTKFKWTYDILQELGSDFGSKMLHEAYQQGRFDEGMDAYYGRDKVEIPQFVADWYEENKDDFENIVQENPFREHYLYDRIHVIFYQESIQSLPLEKLKIDYGEEEICIGNHCLYLYLPRTAKQKKLHTNYLEKLFNVDLTMRKLNVVEKLLSK